MASEAKSGKAQRNLAAAQLLLGSNHPDSCASRSYYAVYLMAYAALEKFGVRPIAGKSYFLHDALPDTLADEGLITPDDIIELELLYSGRVKADYFNDEVEPEEATEALEIAVRLVGVVERGMTGS